MPVRPTHGRPRPRLTACQLLVLGYMTVTLAGAVLLSLPVANTSGASQPFVDALFMAASGISTTGLVVSDVGSGYTTFGQLVLLAVVQLGGIGYMTVVVFLLGVALGQPLSFATRTVAGESLSGAGSPRLREFFGMVLLYTICFEGISTVLLAWAWSDGLAPRAALYHGFFHSVNAFCTAGFTTFPDSLMGYRTDLVTNLTVDLVSIAGGLGFVVLHDLSVYASKAARRIRPRRISLHTRFVLVVTAGLLCFGTVAVLIAEPWPAAASLPERGMVSFFQVVSAQTTDGFNSVDIGRMGSTGLTVLMVLMFVGASPGSTGGGIKTTSLGLIGWFLVAQLKGREDPLTAFGREIPTASVQRAFAVFAYFGILIAADLMILTATEQAGYLELLFETTSALGNTGLSMGVTGRLSTVGRILLTATMFIGRIGPLTMGLFLAGRARPVPTRRPVEDVFVG